MYLNAFFLCRASYTLATKHLSKLLCTIIPPTQWPNCPRRIQIPLICRELPTTEQTLGPATAKPDKQNKHTLVLVDVCQTSPNVYARHYKTLHPV